MRLSRRHRGRGGVSPVMGSLLMIAVAVALSVLIFMWSQGFLSNTSNATEGQQGAENQAAESSISVEAVTFTPCPPSGCVGGASPGMTIVVRNVGGAAVTLDSVTITGAGGNAGFTGYYQTAAIGSGPTAMVSTDATCSGAASPTATASAVILDKGASSTITVAPASSGACTTSGRVYTGDVVNVKVTTTVGSFAQAQFTVS